MKQKMLIIVDYIGESPNSTPYTRLKALKEEFTVDTCIRMKTDYIQNDLSSNIHKFSLINIINIARKNKYDFIYVQGVHNYFYAYIASLFNKGKLIIDIFDHIGLSKALIKSQKGLKAKLKYGVYNIFYILGKYAMKKADKVFLTLNKEILKYYPKRKKGYYHLTNGIWNDIAQSITYKEYENLNKYSFIYVGYVRADRGIFKILEAARFAKESELDFVINILGPVDKSQSKSIFSYIDTFNLEGYINIHGFSDYNKVREYLQKADAAIYFFPPEKIELKYIYPIKIFEYIAYRLPIISSKGKGIKELKNDYNENIILCDYNSSSLFENFKALIQNVNKGYSNDIKEKHLWESINKKFIEEINR